jgi:hypothetical protein
MFYNGPFNFFFKTILKIKITILLYLFLFIYFFTILNLIFEIRPENWRHSVLQCKAANAGGTTARWFTTSAERIYSLRVLVVRDRNASHAPPGKGFSRNGRGGIFQYRRSRTGLPLTNTA